MGYPKSYKAESAPPTLLRLVDKLVPLLIEGEHPALAALREQYSRASLKQVELSGVGFFTYFEVPGDTAVASPPDFAGGHAVITLKGAQLGAGCVLFVRDGRLSTLEGFTYDDEWPEGADVVSVDDVMPIQPSTTLHEHPTHGRIVEVAWTEYPSREGSMWGRKILEEAVHRYEPRCLVINLLGFHAAFGNALFGALVSGAVAMRNLGSGGKTRIVAAGRTAANLDHVLQTTKIGPVFGGGVYPDLESALGNPGLEDQATV